MFENKDYSEKDTQNVSSDVQAESIDSIRKGLASSALPEVSTCNEGQTPKQGCPPTMHSAKPEATAENAEKRQWYVLRATYGREVRAKEYLEEQGIPTFLPIENVVRRIDGKIRHIQEPVLKNIFFGYGTENDLKKMVYDNVHLPFLRFYYAHYLDSNGTLVRRPLIVPAYQMDSFKKICEASEADTIITDKVIKKFQIGDLVKVKAGPFAGVIGRVARYKGQLRVGLVIDNFLTVTTTYIPKAYIEPAEEQKN